MNADMHKYFEQLHSYLKWQTEQIIRLGRQYHELVKEIELLKAQRSIHIDKIEYKFDQLKVEKLDGTLNIGVSPAGGKAIEDLEIQGEQVPLQQDDEKPAGAGQDAEPECFLQMRGRVHNYLEMECPDYVTAVQSKYGLALPPEYGEFVVEDIRIQIEPRIWHYLKSEGVLAGSAGPEQNEAVYGKIKHDIQFAIDRHMQQVKAKGEAKGSGQGG
jgi:spore germination protein PC